MPTRNAVAHRFNILRYSGTLRFTSYSSIENKHENNESEYQRLIIGCITNPCQIYLFLFNNPPHRSICSDYFLLPLYKHCAHCQSENVADLPPHVYRNFTSKIPLLLSITKEVYLCIDAKITISLLSIRPR